jgi:hypothetical protein
VRRSSTVSCVLPILGRTEGKPRVLGESAHLGRLRCPVAGASTGPAGFWHSLAGFWLPWQRDRSNDRTEGHSNTTRGTPTADSSNRGRSCRRYLLAGFILLVAVALLIPIGVIPSVLADTAPGFNAGPTGGFLGITVVFDLMAVAILASALWRPRERDPSSKGTLGTTAFLALWLGLAYGAFGIGILVGEFGPGLRIASVLLILCAVLGLITTALMTVTSVIVDRARLCA